MSGIEKRGRPLRWDERCDQDRRIFLRFRKLDPSWSFQKQADTFGDTVTALGQRLQLAEAFELLPELRQHATAQAAWDEYKWLEAQFDAGLLEDSEEI